MCTCAVCAPSASAGVFCSANKGELRVNTYTKLTKLFVITLVCALALLLVLPALAQAATNTATAERAAPVGIATLVFLLGAGAVLLVGGIMLARDSFRGDSDENPLSG